MMSETLKKETSLRNGRSAYTLLSAHKILPPDNNDNKMSPISNALELLSSGSSDLVVIKKLRDEHNMSLEQAQATIEAAYKLMTEAQKRDLEHKMAIALEQRMKVVAAAFEKEDYRTALAAMEQREKLLGLSDSQKLNENEAAETLLALMQEANKKIRQSESSYGS